MPRLNIENIRKPVAALYPSDVELRCVEVYIPDHDGYLWILAAFVAVLGNDWSWLGTKSDRQTRAQLWQTAYAATLWDLCMKCEDLQECLQPFFDAIQLRFDALDAAVEAVNTTTQQIRETQEGNGAQPLPLPPTSLTSATYAGALALVQAMDRTNRKLYEEAEISAVDNSAEWIGQILDLFPNFSAQGVGAGADMANAYFENQVDAYEADYPDFEIPAACDLMCRIESNGNVLDYDVWGDWLNEIEDLFPGGNAAAAVYAKYSPLRQTFLNQLAAFFNQEASLQSYFDDLWNAYYTGTTNPLPVPPECSCPVRVDVGATVEAPPGVDSFFDVVSGSDYEFTATGTWKGGTGISYDADGNVGTLEPLAIAPSVAVYALVYRITDTGTWLLSGVSNTFTAPASGRVYFAMNDVTGGYSDNEGTITVELVAL